LWVLVDEKLNMSQEYVLAAQKASSILSCTNREVAAGRGMGFSPSALCPHEAHLEYCVQTWGPWRKKYVELLEQIQGSVTKMIREPKHLFYEEGLRELGLISMEKRRLW